MTIDKQIGERLNQFIFENNITQSSVAEIVGVKHGFLNQILKGKKGISAKVIINLTLAFKNLNIRWLLTGEGEMWMLPNYYPPPEIGSGIPDMVQEDGPMRIEPRAYTPEELAQLLQDHERRLRDLEK